MWNSDMKWRARLARGGIATMVALGTLHPVLANEGDNAIDALKSEFRRPETIPFPEYNPYTPEKAALGKMLYFDPRVSGGQNMNCASCHNPSFGWEVPLPRAIGSQNEPLGRHAPTVLNLAWAEDYFWDGRAPTLEEQAKGPIQADVEMNMPLGDLVRRLNTIEGYRTWFDTVFPGQGITTETIVQAIATFERTVVSGQAPFDRWIEGDEDAMADAAKRGFELFNGKARCVSCHTGWNFTDNGFHDIGLRSDDIGRYAVDSSDPDLKFAFKTPGLRDVTQRMPFMHDGSLRDLEAVIAHYNRGGIQRPSLSPEMRPLGLTASEVDDLVAFLQALTGETMQMALPILPN